MYKGDTLFQVLLKYDFDLNRNDLDVPYIEAPPYKLMLRNLDYIDISPDEKMEVNFPAGTRINLIN